MLLYKTINKSGQAEQIIDKSRFIVNVKRVNTKEEADEFIKEMKIKYKDATHNVPAMVIGDKYQIQWCSDDGEPQGTSGAPIVQMLVKEEITNVVVVITRYFGGIKLGTGGLVRAYTSSAKLGIEAAGLCNISEMKIIYYEMDYTYQSKIENIAKNGGFKIENITYTEKIVMEIAVEPENEIEVKQLIENVTKGKYKIVREEVKEVETPEE